MQQNLCCFGEALVATASKDLLISLRQWKTILTSLVMPGTYLLVALLGSIAVGRNPVALVVQDRGAVASQVAQAIIDSEVFRISRVDAQQAESLYDNLSVGAIITIPDGFSQAVQAHRIAPILVRANNLNLDFTNDVKRSVPDAITLYYEGLGAASPLPITIQQRNLRPRDVDLFQYEVVPLITLLVTVCGLIASSAATAREYEGRSIKDLLLAPVGRSAILLGKILAAWCTTCALGLILFTVCFLLGWTRPQGVFVLTTVLAIALLSLFASTLGITLGCVVRRVQSVSVLSTTGSVWLFFLAGGLGVIQFEPAVLRRVAAFDPLTYGTHLLQMAIFYASWEGIGEDLAVLTGAVLALFALGLVAMHPTQMFRKEGLA